MVIVTGRLAVLPTCVPANERLIGEADSCPAAALLVPASAMLMVLGGVLILAELDPLADNDALLVAEIVPLAAPAVCGLKETPRLALWPGPRVRGVFTPLNWKAVLLTLN